MNFTINKNIKFLSILSNLSFEAFDNFKIFSKINLNLVNLDFPIFFK